MQIPSFYETKQSIYSWTNNFVNRNWVAKTIVSCFIWAIALIPVWIYFLFRWLIEPFGFWQELATIIVWAIVLGWLQVVALCFAVPLTLFLIFDT